MFGMRAKTALSVAMILIVVSGAAAEETDRTDASNAPIALASNAVVPEAVRYGSAQTANTARVRVEAPSKRSRLAAPTGAAKRGRLEQRWRYERNKFSPLIERYALENGVPVELAHAMIEIESRFRPGVRGLAGEVGLMQIKPATARMVGFRGSAKALYDPETNIKYGMRYLAKAYQLGSKNGVCGTILKYNAGHGARRMNPISRRYCQKVKAVFARNDRRWDERTAIAYAALDTRVPMPRYRTND